MPMAPYTTEGMPASSSTAGLSTVTIRGGQNCVSRMAQPRPKLTPMTMAPPVTASEPTIMAKMPKEGGFSSGYQSLLKRNLPTPVLSIMGRPSLKM